MTLQRAVLELDADVNPNSSGVDTGVFEMVGDLEIQQNQEIGFILGGSGSTLNAIATSRGSKQTQRRGYHLDLGGGSHTFELNFIGWEGATDSDGNELQWGDGTDTVADATGAGPLTQMQTLNEYLRVGEFDSRNVDARLRFGEYSDGTYAASSGNFDDYIHVAPQRLTQTRTTDDPVTFDGSLTLQETTVWTSIIDSYDEVLW